jgi:hypothetical protein
MSGVIPPLPNTPSWRGTQSTGITLPFRMRMMGDDSRMRFLEAVTYKEHEWLCSSRNDIIASLPVHFQFSGRCHLRRTRLQQLCAWPNDAATVGKISGTPLVQYFSVLS